MAIWLWFELIALPGSNRPVHRLSVSLTNFEPKTGSPSELVWIAVKSPRTACHALEIAMSFVMFCLKSWEKTQSSMGFWTSWFASPQFPKDFNAIRRWHCTSCHLVWNMVLQCRGKFSQHGFARLCPDPVMKSIISWIWLFSRLVHVYVLYIYMCMYNIYIYMYTSYVRFISSFNYRYLPFTLLTAPSHHPSSLWLTSGSMRTYHSASWVFQKSGLPSSNQTCQWTSPISEGF